MSPEQQQWTLALAMQRPGRPRLDPAEFLSRMGSDDGTALSVDVLADAIARRDADDVEMGIIIAAVFGLGPAHLDPLVRLAGADWHHKHEDVARLLGRLADPASVEALAGLATWTPDYLDDEFHGCAVTAVRALGSIPGTAAERALDDIASVAADVVREAATAQLARRRGPGPAAGTMP